MLRYLSTLAILPVLLVSFSISLVSLAVIVSDRYTFRRAAPSIPQEALFMERARGL